MEIEMPDLKLLALSALFAASTSAMAAPLSKIDYATLTGPDVQTVDFEEVALNSGAYYFTSNGVRFGERFAGQQLTSSGTYDVLGSSTTGGSLDVVAGAAEQNLIVTPNGAGNKKLLGASGGVEDRAGSVAMLFSSDQSSFGLRLARGASGYSDISATLKFFNASGALIDTQVVSLNPAGSYGYFAFSHDDKDIRGVSIEQSGANNQFLTFDDIRFGEAHLVAAVPEPQTYALMLAGLSAMGFAAKRRCRGRSATPRMCGGGRS
jgi:hypothetical protein